MRVAICDNNEHIVSNLENIIKKIDRVMLISRFYNVKDLYHIMEDGQKFDLVFMNIDWNTDNNTDKNGIDYAAELTLLDSKMQTIFLGDNSSKYFQHIFLRSINLCGYLEKPIQEEFVRGMVNNAIRYINRDTVDKLEIKFKNGIRLVPYRDIVYMESSNRHVIVHTKYEQIVFYGKLDNSTVKLPYYFLISHKSFVVNMNYISEITRKNIYLTTGDMVDISKSHYLDVKKKFFSYIGSENKF